MFDLQSHTSLQPTCSVTHTFVFIQNAREFVLDVNPLSAWIADNFNKLSFNIFTNEVYNDRTKWQRDLDEGCQRGRMKK